MGYAYYVVVDGPLGLVSRGFEAFIDAVNAAFSLLAQGLYAVIVPV